MADKIGALYELFLQREVAWQDKTDEIFAAADFITSGIINYLDLPVEDIKWDSMDVIGQELMVVVTIPLDDRFQYVHPGDELKQTLTIVLPTSVIEAEDSDLITMFLHDTEDVRKSDHKPQHTEPQGVVGYMNISKRTLH